MEKIYILGAFSYVGENVMIGNNVKIYPNAYIGDNVQLVIMLLFFRRKNLFRMHYR